MKENDFSPSLLVVSDLRITFGEGTESVKAVNGVDFRVGAGEVVGLIGESGSGKTTLALSLLGLLDAKPGIIGGRAELAGKSLFPLPEDYLKNSDGTRKRHFQFQRDQRKLLAPLLGRELAAIFQEPKASLDPFYTVGDHLTEVMRRNGFPVATRRTRGEASLRDVGLAEADKLWDLYPHQISGGMAQRVMIAMALCASPRLLIADEPTTALDVTTQAKLLQLLGSLNRDQGLSVLLISHDIGVIREICSRVYVMHKGWIVESGPTAQVLESPKHPYTASLLGAFARFGERPVLPPGNPEAGPGCAYRNMCAIYSRSLTESEKNLCAKEKPGFSSGVDSESPGVTGGGRCHFPGQSKELRALNDSLPQADASEKTGSGSVPALRAISIRKRFGGGGDPFLAVAEVSLEVPAGTTYGLVGESGSGKTTLALALLGLQRPEAGEVWIEGKNLLSAAPGELRNMRKKIRMLFQHPEAVLNSGMTIGQTLHEGLEREGMQPGARRERILESLRQVRLDESYLERFPSHLSSGEKQRVCIARAIATRPAVLVCDEPVASLDLAIQSQILALLSGFQRDLGMTYLFISHNLAMVKLLASRIGVMYMGRLVEEADAGNFTAEAARHPYSKLLLASVPAGDAQQAHQALLATYPDTEPVRLREGCPFRNRCPLYLESRESRCEQVVPELRNFEGNSRVACHLAV